MLEQPEFLNHRATPHHLLMKSLFLVALATGNRVSEIAAFTKVGSKILPGSRKAIITVRPGFLYKNQTMDRSPPPTLSSRHCWTRTLPLIGCALWTPCAVGWPSPTHGESTSSSPTPNLTKMNRGAVSLLLVTTIYRSQPGVLAKAHDVRKVIATFAWARGVPPHQIIQPCSGNPPAYF